MENPNCCYIALQRVYCSVDTSSVYARLLSMLVTFHTTYA
jgi:hypothetical protein